MSNRDNHEDSLLSDDDFLFSSDANLESQLLEGEDVLDNDLNDYQNIAGDGVLISGGRRLAVGLVWLTFGDSDEQKSINNRAKSLGADFFCVRSVVSQAGFGGLQKGHRMGMASAAAMAADALVGEWHGVFVADNGWHYIAVHSDTIAPMGDRFFDSEEDAYNHFLLQAEAFKWPRTYVPATWNFKDNDSEIPYDRLIDDIPTTSLRPVNLDALFSGKSNKNIALILGALFIGFLILSMFSEEIITNIIPKRAEVARPNLDVAPLLAPPPEAPKEKIDPMTLAIEKFNLPNPALIAKHCVENFDELMVSIPGWNLRTMRCRNAFVEAIWDRGVGGLDNIKAHIQDFPFGVGTTFGSRGDFLVSKVMGGLSKFDQKAEFVSREKILVLLNDRFGSLGRLDVRDVVPISKQNNNRRATKSRNERFAGRENNDSEEKVITIQDLPSLSITYQTNASISRIGDQLNIPGLKIDLIEWDLLKGSWVYHMKIFLAPKK